MQSAPRILRAMALERDRVPRFVNLKQRERHERILTIAQGLFANAGFHTISFSGMAIALRIAAGTLRYHFADLDALLGELIRRHLRRLTAELGKVPQDAPNRQQDCRAAYLAYTRVGAGSLSEPHRLLVEYGHLLPQDERQTIERLRDGLAETLAGHLGHEALLLLDSPLMNARRIDTVLMALNTAETPACTQTAAPPEPPPKPLPKPQATSPQRPDRDPSLSAMVLTLAKSGTARAPPY